LQLPEGNRQWPIGQGDAVGCTHVVSAEPSLTKFAGLVRKA
jgi:hypothetical protein